MIETIGLAVVAMLFAWAAIDHIADAKKFIGYTGSVLKTRYLSWLGGIPAGVYLAITSVGILVHEPWGFWMAAGFLAATQVLFHRDISDALNRKHAALLGAMVALAVLV